MRTTRLNSLFVLAINLAVASLPAMADRVIATVPVGPSPLSPAVNIQTDRIYVANQFGNSVTVIDGTTNSVIATVQTGISPVVAAVNEVTNKIYVANQYDDTVTVIDGTTYLTLTVPVGNSPSAVVVNPITNKIYVLNPNDDTVTVIDGATNSTTTVTVQDVPSGIALNMTTNKIYVSNQNGSSVTVIDGPTNGTTTVPVGGPATGLAVNAVTNKIYVSTCCDTVTIIDGATLSTSTVSVGPYPSAVAVNSVTNKIYVVTPGDYTVTVIDGSTNATSTVFLGADLSNSAVLGVNSVTNKIYVTRLYTTLAIIDGRTDSLTMLEVGSFPFGLAVNPASDRVYVANYGDNTVSVIDGTLPTALQFVPLAQPCRAVDTRPGNGGGGPIQGGTFQSFPISGAGSCATMPSAALYSMNVSVVPNGYLGYLTVWPAGQTRPLVSTLNSLDGRIKANAAIVPAGSNGQVSVYATDTTNVILDVNGYFAPVSGSTLAFYPLPPCRVADTRHSGYPQGLGPPFLTGGQQRDFPILNATSCNIPSSGVAAYSLNFAVVPHGPLGYMTVWPTGETRPTVSTLNDIPGQIIANAAIVVAGTSGNVSVYPASDTDVVIDINGYFAEAGTGGLSLYSVPPCRVIDTRHIGSGQPFTGILSPPVDVVDSACGISSLAQAYVFNASVVPVGPLGYLTLWPDGSSQPLVSTLNALDGSISSNMAIVPTNNGKVDAFASGITQLILDISSFFAP